MSIFAGIIKCLKYKIKFEVYVIFPIKNVFSTVLYTRNTFKQNDEMRLPIAALSWNNSSKWDKIVRTSSYGSNNLFEHQESPGAN